MKSLFNISIEDKALLDYPGIYRIYDNKNRSYIGKATSLYERLKTHARAPLNDSPLLHNAIRASKEKGLDNFYYEILEKFDKEVISSEQELDYFRNRLNTLEQQNIKKYNSLKPNGFNLLRGGDGGRELQLKFYEITAIRQYLFGLNNINSSEKITYKTIAEKFNTTADLIDNINNCVGIYKEIIDPNDPNNYQKPIWNKEKHKLNTTVNNIANRANSESYKIIDIKPTIKSQKIINKQKIVYEDLAELLDIGWIFSAKSKAYEILTINDNDKHMNRDCIVVDQDTISIKDFILQKVDLSIKDKINLRYEEDLFMQKIKDYKQLNKSINEGYHSYYNKVMDLSYALEHKQECIDLIKGYYNYTGPISTGGYYILPDGSAIKSTNHADIDKLLIKQDYIIPKEGYTKKDLLDNFDYGDGSQFLEAVGAVRLRRRGGKDSWMLPYLTMSNVRPTTAQLEIMIDWLDFVLKASGEIMVIAPSNYDGVINAEHVYKRSLDDTTDDIIDDIKHFYITKSLPEDLIDYTDNEKQLEEAAQTWRCFEQF